MFKRTFSITMVLLSMLVFLANSTIPAVLYPSTVSAQEPTPPVGIQNDENFETQEFNSLTKITCPECPEWRPNVRMEILMKDQYKYVCSGTLVDPKHVLTAGHCIFSHKLPSGLDPWPISIEVVPAYENNNKPYGDSLASDWFVFPEWQNIVIPVPNPIPDLPDFNYDIAIIELVRPIGALTGWYRIAYNNDDSFFTNNTFDNPGFPGEGNYDSQFLHTWSGQFDCATFDGFDKHLLFHYDRDPLEGHSGGGILLAYFGDTPQVYGVLSGEGASLFCRPDKKPRARYTRITQNKYNDFQNFMISNTPITPDLIPLDVNIASSTIAAGNQIPLVDFLFHNYSSATWTGTVPIKIYLSTDDKITDSDTLLGTVSYSGQIGPKQSVRVTLTNLPKIPADKSGKYWLGIKLDIQDVDPNNNTTQGWDAQEITVTKSSSVQTENISVALIIDATGSMVTNDPNNMRKTAAKVFIDSAQIGDKIAIVAFNTKKYHYGRLRTIRSKADRDSLKAAVDKVGASDGTDIDLGLQGGFEELLSDGSNNAKTAVLLTDGANDPPKDTTKHLLFKNKGWPIYTVGLGQAKISELRKIATDTGGECVNNCAVLQDPNQLQPLYFEILQKVAGGNTVFNQSVSVPQGTNQRLMPFVPADQKSATFFTGWSGTPVLMSLVSPSGRQITPSTSASDVYYATGSTYRIYTIQQPEAGQWRIEVSRSSSVSSASTLTEGDQVDIRVAVRKNPDPFKVFLPVALRNYKPGTTPPPPSPPSNRAPRTPSGPSPVANATDTIVTTKLFWSSGDPDPDDTVTYKVYFDANTSNPTTLLCNNTSASLCDPPGNLNYDTNYYWKVVATDSHNATSTGSVWHFKTGAAPPKCNTPGTPLLSAPGNDTILTDDTPTFTWTPANDGNEYYLQVDNNVDFSSPEINLAVNNTEYISSSAMNNGTYYWRVLAHNHTSQCSSYGSWSNIWSFRVQAGPVWSSAVNLSNSSGGSESPDVTIDLNGGVYVVWSDNSHGLYNIYYTNKVSSGGWSAPINISNQSTDAKYPNIFVDNARTIHIVWGDGKVYYSRKSLGGNWSTPVLIDNGHKPKLAVGGNNSVHIVWEKDKDIYYSIKVGTGPWSSVANLSNTTADSYDPDIALDSGNRPHIVWDEGPSLSADILYITQLNSSNWSSPENISNTTATSHFAKIVIDSSDKIYVFWPDGDDWGITNKVMFNVKPKSGSWSIAESLFSGNVSFHPQPAIGSDGTLRLSWTDSFDAFYSKQWGGTWLLPFNVSSNPATGWVTALASGQQFDALVWVDNEPGNSDIYYSEADSNAIWSSTTSFTTLDASPLIYPAPTPAPSLDIGRNPNNLDTYLPIVIKQN